MMYIHHVAIIASNYKKSKAFYVDLLGFEVLAEQFRASRNSWKCDLGINGRYFLELFSFPNPPPRLNSPEACGLRHLAFSVANVVEKRMQLLEKGVLCEAIRLDEMTGKFFFFIKDPDGLPLEFYQI